MVPMARPINFDPQQVLLTATRVFYERGYEQTGIEDIVRAAGVSRHSLYLRWGDKDGLFAACLEVYGGYTQGTVMAPLQPERGRQGVLDFIDALSAELIAEPVPACLMVQTLLRTAPDAAPTKRAEDHFRTLSGRAAACLRIAAERGELPESIDPDGIGELLALIVQGLSVSRRSGLDVGRTRAALASVKALL